MASLLTIRVCRNVNILISQQKYKISSHWVLMNSKNIDETLIWKALSCSLVNCVGWDIHTDEGWFCIDSNIFFTIKNHQSGKTTSRPYI